MFVFTKLTKIGEPSSHFFLQNLSNINLLCWYFQMKRVKFIVAAFWIATQRPNSISSQLSWLIFWRGNVFQLCMIHLLSSEKLRIFSHWNRLVQDLQLSQLAGYEAQTVPNVELERAFKIWKCLYCTWFHEPKLFFWDCDDISATHGSDTQVPPVFKPQQPHNQVISMNILILKKTLLLCILVSGS